MWEDIPQIPDLSRIANDRLSGSNCYSNPVAANCPPDAMKSPFSPRRQMDRREIEEGERLKAPLFENPFFFVSCGLLPVFYSVKTTFNLQYAIIWLFYTFHITGLVKLANLELFTPLKDLCLPFSG